MINKHVFEEFYLSHSNEETAQKFGINICTVCSWVKKFGILSKRHQYKKLKDEFKQYFETHSYEETASYFGVNDVTVWRWCQEFGVAKKREAKQVDKKEFESYLVDHSIKETAKQFGICTVQVNKIARELNMKRRCRKYKDVKSSLTSRQIEIIYGSLLGDGSLSKINPKRGEKLSMYNEAHCIKQEEYLFWKYNELGEFAGSYNRNYLNNIINGKEHYASSIWSIGHQTFTDMEKDWYLRDEIGNYALKPNGHRIKVVPRTLILTPLMLAIWYLDDGYRPKLDRQHYIATLGFTSDECEFLVDQIKELGIKFCKTRRRTPMYRNIQKEYTEIAIGAKSSLDFLNLIENLVDVSCLKYKLVKRELRDGKIVEVNLQ